MSAKLRDADGCEDFESLEESGVPSDEPADDEEDSEERTEEGDSEAEPEDGGEEQAEKDGEEESGFGDNETSPDDEERAEKEPGLQEQLRAEQDRYVRLLAEFENYRKRTSREKSETYSDAVSKTVADLLPVIDSFERAMEAPCSDEAYRGGMENIYRQLGEFLKKLGVEEIPALGEVFDPKVHNAVHRDPDSEREEGTVCEVYQKGYRLGARVLRCAMVGVAGE